MLKPIIQIMFSLKATANRTDADQRLLVHLQRYFREEAHHLALAIGDHSHLAATAKLDSDSQRDHSACAAAARAELLTLVDSLL